MRDLAKDGNLGARMGARLYASFVLLFAGTCSLPPFECASDDSCRLGGALGFCQPRTAGSYCVFPDRACPDGLRWDHSAPEDVADTCFHATCSDGIRNGVPGQSEETDVDCGGPLCPACPAGALCAQDSDCALKHCDSGFCGGYSCEDGTRNGDESSVDCGGPMCPPCSDSSNCNDASDCLHRDCTNHVCATPQCNDGRRNGSEVDVDCSGPVCPPCGPGRSCNVPADCSTGICQGGVCTSLTFVVGASVAAGPMPTTLVATDYDGDRIIDLVVNNEGVVPDNRGNLTSRLTLLRGDGAGKFKSQPNAYATYAASQALVTGDFNQDGFADFALANTPLWEVAMIMSLGPGVLFPESITLDGPSLGAAVADFNGDGRPDVAFSESIDSLSVLVNDRWGGFEIVRSYRMLQRHLAGGPAMIAADLDGDGDVDVAYADSVRGVVVATNDGQAHFGFQTLVAAGAGVIRAMAAGDLDGDKRADLVCVDSAGQVMALPNEGALRFTDQHTAVTGPGIRAVDVALADLDGDGRLDAVAPTTEHTVLVLLGNGKGDLVRGGTLSVPDAGNIGHVALADLDGDRRVDIAGTDGKSSKVYVWLRP